MKHFSVIYRWLVVCMAFVVSCSGRGALDAIEQASMLMESDPVRALEGVRGVDAEQLRTRIGAFIEMLNA